MRISQWKAKIIFTLAYLACVAVMFSQNISCLFLKYFGFVCPGCGMTRAILAAVHLQFKTAFFYHPMFWSIPILYLYFLSDDGLFSDKRLDRLLLAGIGAGFLVNWLIKLL